MDAKDLRARLFRLLSTSLFFQPLAVTLALLSSTSADIYRWDTGELIPGTEGVSPQPQLNVYGVEWSYADLADANLGEASIRRSNLQSARLTDALLVNAAFERVTLYDADFSGALIRGLTLSGEGFSQQQLYSTESYQQFDLQEIRFLALDLQGWDFSGQDLRHAVFGGLAEAGQYTNLSGANFANSNLAEASLRFANLNETNWSDAQMQGSDLIHTKLVAADFSNAHLSNAALNSSVLLNASLTGADLTNAELQLAALAGANFSDAIIKGVNLSDAQGFTKEQLYSTASYTSQDLQGLQLEALDVSQWNFRGQNLASSDFSGSDVSLADFTNADLRGVNFSRVMLPLADFRGADLRNANFEFTTVEDLPWALVDNGTVYNQGTQFPEGFDPQSAGMQFIATSVGDVNASDALDASDLDMLSERIIRGRSRMPWLPDEMFDLNSDAVVDLGDHAVWVHELKETWFGDANLDGQFDTADLTSVFQFGQYEDSKRRNSTWATGDWNGDAEFTSTDLVIAFQDGGYEQGPRAVVSSVPEPSTASLIAFAATITVSSTRRKRV